MPCAKDRHHSFLVFLNSYGQESELSHKDISCLSAFHLPSSVAFQSCVRWVSSLVLQKLVSTVSREKPTLPEAQHTGPAQEQLL